MTETKAEKKARIARAKKLREARLSEVESAMVLGLRSKEIESTLAPRHGVSDRMIRKDMESIRDRWADEAEKDGRGPYRRNALRLRAEALYRKTLADKAYGPAVRILALLADIDGLKVLRIEHSEADHGLKDMTSDDKRQRLEELMAMARERAAARKDKSN